jgi:Ca-activated chloride channel family protein
MSSRDRTRNLFIVIVGAGLLIAIFATISSTIGKPTPEPTGQSADTAGTRSSEPSTSTQTRSTGNVVSISDVEILMLTADTKAEWVVTATEPFNAQRFKTASGKTISVTVMEEGSPGDAQQAVIDGEIQPVVWSPGDISWVETANQVWQDLGKGALVTGECPRIVYAATGFAMWEPMAKAMGWPDTPIGWDDIVALAADVEGWGRYGHPEWGQFKFGHTHPEHSNTGFFVLATLVYNSLDAPSGLTPELVKSDPVIEAFKKVELNTYHYGYSTRALSVLMAHQGPSYLHALTSSETSVLATNKYEPDKLFPYVFIFPAEGTFWSDNPFCILDTEWVSDEEREAAEIYRDFLLQPEQQDLAVSIGLRPANPDVPLHCPICLEYYTDPRVSPETVPPLENVSGETAEAIIDVFNQTKKKATTVLVLDTSGSMSGDKIRMAKEGVVRFLEELDKDDEVMVYLFSDSVETLQPLARAGSVVESLRREVEETGIDRYTTLYDAVCQAKGVAEVVKAEDEAAGEMRLYGIVLLSDGEDTRSRITEEVMFEQCLPQSESADVVKIFTIGYGRDANEELLEQIAGRTNGRAFVADPDNIEEVYLAISAEQ